MNGLIAALAFLTRVPVAQRREFSAAQVAAAAGWFPVVGCGLGLLQAAVARGLEARLSAAVIAVLLVGLAALLTGALHLDGLADTADGFGGGGEPADVLRIMRDHAIGAYGAVAVGLGLAFQITVLASLLPAGHLWAELGIAGALSRWSAVALAATQPDARAEQGGRVHTSLAALFTPRGLFFATLAAAVLLAGLAWMHLGLRAIVAAGLVLALTLAWGGYCRRRIGGITGDTIGALVVVSECLALLVFAWRAWR